MSLVRPLCAYPTPLAPKLPSPHSICLCQSSGDKKAKAVYAQKHCPTAEEILCASAGPPVML